VSDNGRSRSIGETAFAAAPGTTDPIVGRIALANSVHVLDTANSPLDIELRSTR
jgi:hypothetical protein